VRRGVYLLGYVIIPEWQAMKKEKKLVRSNVRLSRAKEVAKHWFSVTIMFQIELGKLPIFPFFNHSATDLLF